MYKLYVEIHTNMHTDQRYIVCPIILYTAPVQIEQIRPIILLYHA
jgi:hypothetical protein